MMRWKIGMDHTIGSGAGAAVVFVMLCTATALAGDPQSDMIGVDYFESKVRPVLIEHCYKCHSGPVEVP